jgi:hypothetical protein
MQRLSDWQYSTIDGTSTGPGVLHRKIIPREMTTRLIYAAYIHNGVLAMAGKECWIVFLLGGKEVLRLPACLIPEANVRVGFAMYKEAHDEGKARTNGTLYWNNSSGIADDYGIAPFLVQIEADEVLMEHTMTAAVNYSVLAVMSFVPFKG